MVTAPAATSCCFDLLFSRKGFYSREEALRKLLTGNRKGKSSKKSTAIAPPHPSGNIASSHALGTSFPRSRLRKYFPIPGASSSERISSSETPSFVASVMLSSKPSQMAPRAST